ncbi:MAG: hypothetical protein ACM31P_00100 [Actinomycetota bacterium]
MHTRHPRPPARLMWKAGLTCLLAAGAEMPFLAQADALPEPPQCQEGNPGVAIAPELLALADWPLDPPGAAYCPSLPAVAEDVPALPAEEVAGYPAVVRVVAGEAPPADEGLVPDESARDLFLFAGTAMSLEDDSLAPPETVPALPAAPTIAETEGSRQRKVSPEDLPDLAPDALGEQMAALDASTLDGIRGGFETPDGGLKFSFGIERAVYINGELVASTVLNLKDLQSAVGAGVPAALAGSALTVIQNGSGNGFSAQINPNLAGTVIQNTLNDQRIVNVTTINAAVNSAQVLRAMALQSAIRDGVVGSLRR